MKLTIQQLKRITWGAVEVCEEDGGTVFHRFTKEQEQLYQARFTPEEEARYARSNATFQLRSQFTAGVRLVFCTDSETLALTASVLTDASRSYFSFDVFADHKPVGYLDNFPDTPSPAQDCLTLPPPVGAFSGRFSLGAGEKIVTVYLPWSCKVILRELSLDDGASVLPVKAPKKILFFGDSITQGYDALRPSNRYPAKLANWLGAEEVSKAIGGEFFFPALANLRDSFDPEWIIVSYGTNDWYRKGRGSLSSDCTLFYQNLTAAYPNTPILALTPLWRADHAEVRACGSLLQAAAHIREIACKFPGIHVLNGYDLVPHEKRFFTDRRVHPNDEGFSLFAQNLITQLTEIL